MKILLGTAATVLALTVLTGCSGDDGDTTAQDPASTPSTTEPTASVAPTVGSYPELAATDYSFTLEQQCFCPITGPVRVTVEDGEVTEAVVLRGGSGVPRGSDAPEYLRITINDVIAEANDTQAASVDVTWPEGQDWPDSVAVDRIERATDDEITYVVSDVEIAG